MLHRENAPSQGRCPGSGRGGGEGSDEGGSGLRAKGRPRDKRIPILLSEASHLGASAIVTPAARALVARFWPGPLTIVLTAPRDDRVPRAGERPRAASHRRERRGLPVTSANLSGRPDATRRRRSSRSSTGASLSSSTAGGRRAACPRRSSTAPAPRSRSSARAPSPSTRSGTRSGAPREDRDRGRPCGRRAAGPARAPPPRGGHEIVDHDGPVPPDDDYPFIVLQRRYRRTTRMRRACGSIQGTTNSLASDLPTGSKKAISLLL